MRTSHQTMEETARRDESRKGEEEEVKVTIQMSFALSDKDGRDRLIEKH